MFQKLYSRTIWLDARTSKKSHSTRTLCSNLLERMKYWTIAWYALIQLCSQLNHHHPSNLHNSNRCYRLYCTTNPRLTPTAFSSAIKKQTLQMSKSSNRSSSRRITYRWHLWKSILKSRYNSLGVSLLGGLSSKCVLHRNNQDVRYSNSVVAKLVVYCKIKISRSKIALSWLSIKILISSGVYVISSLKSRTTQVFWPRDLYQRCIRLFLMSIWMKLIAISIHRDILPMVILLIAFLETKRIKSFSTMSKAVRPNLHKI